MNSHINLKIKEFVTANEESDIAQIFLLHHNDKLDFGCRFVQKDYEKVAEYDCTVSDFAILLTFILNDPFFDKMEGEGKFVVEFGSFR